jgi:hypothetical protein
MMKMTDEIIAHFAEGELSPVELALRLGLSLRELARWAGESDNIQLLSTIAFLADVRAQMLVARYRASAAARLIAIATEPEASEHSRKACVDLLTTNLEVFSPRGSCEREGPAGPSEQTILDALEKLGET